MKKVTNALIIAAILLSSAATSVAGAATLGPTPQIQKPTVVSDAEVSILQGPVSNQFEPLWVQNDQEVQSPYLEGIEDPFPVTHGSSDRIL